MLPVLGALLSLAAAPLVGAAAILENFSSDPASHGWGIFGDASLFRWDAVNQNLNVTWDSSRSNSYFHLPLGTILTKSDDFSFSFDVRLNDIRPGSTPGKLHEFQIALA